MNNSELYVIQLDALLESIDNYVNNNDVDKASALMDLARGVLMDLKSEVFIEEKGE